MRGGAALPAVAGAPLREIRAEDAAGLRLLRVHERHGGHQFAYLALGASISHLPQRLSGHPGRGDDLRGELLLWPIVLLPLGALLAALSQSEIVQSIGFFLLALAIVIPIFMRLLQKRESIAARRASEAQNEARYSEPMCREDALSTSRQTKLIYLCPEYGAEGADIAMIARDTGVALETARLIQKLSAAAQQFLREPTKTRIPFASFDKSDAL